MPRIIVFGDSNVAGSVESWKNDLFPRALTWPGRLKAKYGTVFIDGVPGRLLSNSAQQLGAAIAAASVEIIVLCIGINDLYYDRSADEVIAQLQKILDEFKGQAVYVLHPGVVYSRDALAKQQKAKFVARQLEFKQKIKQIAAIVVVPEARVVGADRWHFSLSGHEEVFNLVDKALEQITQNFQ